MLELDRQFFDSLDPNHAIGESGLRAVQRLFALIDAASKPPAQMTG